MLNNANIPEADYFTPEKLEYTYVDVEISLPIDVEGTDFAKVMKFLWDVKGIPIGRSNENPMLDTRVYEVEYLDGHKAHPYYVGSV